jgi:WD40 repeat protein
VEDGKCIAVAQTSGTTIIDRNSEKILHRFVGWNHSVAPAGNVIAIAEGQKSGQTVAPGVALFTLEGKKIKSLRFPEQIREFMITADGKYLVVCSEDRFLKIFDAANGNLLRSIEGAVSSPVTVSDNGKFIAAVLNNSQIAIWDFATGAMIAQSPAGPPYRIDRTSVSEDGQYVVFTESSGKLSMWDTKDGEHTRSLTTHNGPVEKIESNARNGLSASLSQDGRICVWETATGKDAYTLSYFDNLLMQNLTFSHDGKYIVTFASRTVYDPGSPKGNYHTDEVNASLWDAGSGEWIREYPFGPDDWISNLGFTRDDKGLLVSIGDNIQKYDIATGKLVSESRPHTTGRISPQSTYSVAFAYPNNGDIAVWNLSRDTLEFIRNAHPGFTRTVSVSDDETILVSSGQEDQKVKVWEMPQGKLRNEFRMNVPQVHPGCVSPSGKYFAGGSVTGAVSIWDLKSGRLLQSFNDYPCYLWSVAWSPDEKLIFGGFNDGTIIAVRNLEVK